MKDILKICGPFLIGSIFMLFISSSNSLFAQEISNCGLGGINHGFSLQNDGDVNNILRFSFYRVPEDIMSVGLSKEGERSRDLSDSKEVELKERKRLSYLLPVSLDLAPIVLMSLWLHKCSTSSTWEENDNCNKNMASLMILPLSLWSLFPDSYVKASSRKKVVSALAKFTVQIIFIGFREIGEALITVGCAGGDDPDCSVNYDDTTNDYAYYVAFLGVIQLFEVAYHASKVYDNNREYELRNKESRNVVLPYVYKDQIGLAFQSVF